MYIAWLENGWQKLDLASESLLEQLQCMDLSQLIWYLVLSRLRDPLIHNCLCSSRTILEKYLKRAVLIARDFINADKKSISRQCQTHFHLAHYTDALFRNHEERLNSSEWQAAMRLRKHKVLYRFFLTLPYSGR